MLDPALTITRLGGVARGENLRSFGLTRSALARAVTAGHVQRVRSGVFAAPGAHRHTVDAAAHGGALTCGAALLLHEVWVLDKDAPPHVWMGRSGRVHPHESCRCVSHYFDGESRLGVVDVETALLHLHRCAGDEAFFAALESAWRKALLPRAARIRIRAALPKSDRWLVDIARPDADSGLESLLRLRLHLLGIRLDSQVLIPGVGKVDFVAAGRLIIEVDGRENHEWQTLRHKDLRRDAAASALGYETLRFDYAQVLYDWPSVQAAILAALGRVDA